MNCEIFIKPYGSGSYSRLDLSGDFPVQITYNILDIRQPDKRQSHWSKTILFPGTAVNNRVFGHIFEIGIDSSFNPNKKADCYILQNSIEIARGVLQLQKISSTEGLIRYETSFTAGIDDLFTILGDLKLSDLDYSDLDHIWDNTNVSATWSATPGTGYVYPMINYDGRAAGASYTSPDDYYPAVYVKEYVDRLFTYAGKKYSSAFFNSAFFKRLIIPFNKVKPQASNATILANEVQAHAASNQQITLSNTVSASATIHFDTIDTDPAGAFDTGAYHWTVPNTGRYQVETSGYCNLYATTPVTLTGSRIYMPEWRVKVNGVIKATEAVSMVITGGSWSAGALISSGQMGAGIGGTKTLFNLALTAGDIVTVEMYFPPLNAFGASWSGTVAGEAHSGSYIHATPPRFLSPGNLLDMNQCIPETLAKDFITGLVKMFCLYMEEQDNGILLIEPRDSYYLSTTVNWASKVAQDRGIDIMPMSELKGRRYIFRYKEDKDYWNEYYQSKYLLDGKPMTYGEKVYEVDNDFLKDDSVTETVFSATPLVGNNANPRIISQVYQADVTNANPKFSATNIRILYWGGNGNGYPYAGHLDDPYNPTLDLSFGIPAELNYAASLYTDNNLFNQYWRRFITEISDSGARLVTAWLHLLPTDIYNLSFRSLYYLEGDLWRLNKIIDYDPTQDRLTKCEFIKVNDGGAFSGSTGAVTGGWDDIGPTGENWPMITEGGYTDWAGNTFPTAAAVVKGSGNYVPDDCNGVVIAGDDNIIGQGSTNILIQGSSNVIAAGQSNITLVNTSNATITESDVLYINGCKVSGCVAEQSGDAGWGVSGYSDLRAMDTGTATLGDVLNYLGTLTHQLINAKVISA